MLVVVVPVIVLTLGFAWWYRASQSARRLRSRLVLFGAHRARGLVDSGDGRHPAGGSLHGSARTCSIPPAKLNADAKPMRIEAVSLDWKWLFIYPDSSRHGQ